MIHPNSITAFASIIELRATREGAILRFLREHGPATDREVMQWLGFTEANQTRQRISELVREGRVLEVGTRICPVTGRPVRVISAELV
jgi:predicted ArsR family transcriptional regulator